MKYTHKKRDHSSSPFTPKPWIKKVQGSFSFTTTAKYQTIDPINQADWNKLCGISFNPLKPNQDAIMIAWRYNTVTGYIEIAPYFNAGGAIINPDTNYKKEIINIIPFETIEFWIDFWGINYKEIDSNVWHQVPVPRTVRTNKWTSFFIQPWFGGDEPAPQDIDINLNI